ncbi:MAG: DUF2796 domain-containing protein [Burkholderiaceae bacterium]|jgi:hypothetical protein|nr:DUF2796 domain-containing protein [Burkholderiaceae bacterium]
MSSSRCIALALWLGAVAVPALAQPHAHTHGRMALDVAVDGQSVALRMEAPLEGLLGFERAPRTAAERQRVADMVARLKAADSLFQVDAAGACSLDRVALHSPVLGLGGAGRESAAGADAVDEADDGHADIDVDMVFRCAQPDRARFIDVRLFDSYPRVLRIDAQVATPRGQFKRSLRPQASRLGLVR